jgi:hypothetical protein
MPAACAMAARRCAGVTQAEAAQRLPQRRSASSGNAGVTAYFAWVRAWREDTGGSQAEGRAAWQRLLPEEKWKVKAEAAAGMSPAGDNNGKGTNGSGAAYNSSSKLHAKSSTVSHIAVDAGGAAKPRRGPTRNAGVVKYHDWIAAYRQREGVDLATARAAYRCLSDEDKSRLAEEHCTVGMSIAEPAAV